MTLTFTSGLLPSPQETLVLPSWKVIWSAESTVTSSTSCSRASAPTR